MDIESAVYAKLVAVLAADPAVADAAARVYPDGVPDEPGSPYVIYQHEGDSPQFYLNAGRDETEIDLFAVEAWGRERADVAAVRDVFRTAFQGANAAGRWGGDGGLWVWGAFLADAAADAQPVGGGSEDIDRCARMTLRVVWRRGA